MMLKVFCASSRNQDGTAWARVVAMMGLTVLARRSLSAQTREEGVAEKAAQRIEAAIW